jgi:hypothetical protein
VTNLPLPNNLLFVGLFIALAVVTIAALQTFRRGNRNANALWLFYLAFTPPLLLFIISQWIPVYIERALLPSGVIFCLWLAWAMFNTALPAPIRNGLLALLAIGITMGLYQHITYRGFPYAPYQALNESLLSRAKHGDVILHSSKAIFLPSTYYNPAIRQDYLADPAGSNIDTLALATQQALGLLAQSDVESATRGASRVWFIVFQRHIDAYAQIGYEAHPHLMELEEYFTVESIEEWGDLRVYLFVRATK